MINLMPAQVTYAHVFHVYALAAYVLSNKAAYVPVRRLSQKLDCHLKLSAGCKAV